ncbi:MAG: ferrochelatase [Thermodesulfovibrionia bacterium]|nr:ferrochelatase [Thermodesulfovibrionia bacterium]
MTVRDNDKETVGILLLNLGGPDSLKAVKPFLYNLFSDRDIIRLGPSFLQKPIAWLISSSRSKETKKLYSLIGGKSPIFDITAAQAEALEKALNQGSGVRGQGSVNNYSLFTVHYPLSFKVYIGMRYWNPFIKVAVENILKDGIKHLIVLSLYPHYSKATTGSALAEFKRVISECTPTHPSPLKGEGEGGGGMEVKYIKQWYDFPLYIDSLAELISKGLSEFNENPPTSPFSKGGLNESPPLTKDTTHIPPLAKGGEGGLLYDVLFSAHSLPESFIKEGDPYVDHINTTISEVCKRLYDSPYNIKNLKWHLSFQSRSGTVKWLQPATDETIIKLAKEGVKNLLVVPISFVSDHVETLYEIDILYKELAGRHGINFKRCKSLNTSEKFINALKELVVLKIKEFIL